MTLTWLKPKLIAPLAVFACLLAVLLVANRSGDSVERASAATPNFARLGDDLLGRWRETGDPSLFARASRAYDAALRRDAGDVGALIGAGTLANLRHDFRGGLRLGLAARRAAPDLARPYTLLADSRLELGRYAGAERSIQRLIDLKPTLASYSRVSYYRELTGDLAGAVEAMRLAVSAGGGAGESTAYVQTLLGDLELQRGRPAAAVAAYRGALASSESYPQAQAGLARVDAARGDLRAAIRRLRVVAERLPLTSHLTLLAESELAAGATEQGRRDLGVVRAQQRLLRSGGAAPDAELVLFEANHGSPRAAVRLGRRVWREAPSVRSADALGWALTRAGRPGAGLAWATRALRTGSRDPGFRLHAGIAARRAGRADIAERDLAAARDGAAALSPLARRTLP